MQGDQHPVRQARRQKRWRLVDLADKCAASAPLLSMIEHGYVPKRGTQLSIANALGIPVDELWPEDAE